MALVYNGSNQRSTKDSTPDCRGALSFCCWVYRVTTGTWQCLVSQRDTGSNANCYLGFDTNNRIYLEYSYPGQAGINSIGAGSWVFVAWRRVISPSLSNIVYVNGVQEINDTTETTANTVGNWDIGAYQLMGNFVDYLSARIADLRWYNRALSLDEFETIRHSSGADRIVDGLVRRYGFNESHEGATALASIPDLTGSGNAVTSFNSPTYVGDIVLRRKRA